MRQLFEIFIMKDKEFPLYVQVCVDIESLKDNKLFSYGVPEDMTEHIYIGVPVKVPFGHRDVVGYVIDVFDFPPPVPRGVRIKPVIEIIHEESLWNREMIELARWIRDYYSSSLVSALKVLIPGPVRVTKDGDLPAVSRVKKIIPIRDPLKSADELPKRNVAQRRVLEYLAGRKGAVRVTDVVKETMCSYSTLYTLQERGYVDIFDVSPSIKYFHHYPARLGGSLELTEDQSVVFEKLKKLYNSEKAEVALLHGVTGSGKTELYLQVIELALLEGKESLVLVPEISLTPQAIERFRGRFGEEVAVLHSKLTGAERRQMWWKIRDKKVKVVLGARSAVFAPLENIGVIVVDEEHETSYKQEKEPRYHARQVAIKRGLHHNALVILGSATPTLEVYHWAKQGYYHYLELPGRIGQSVMPEVEIVNLKKDIPKKTHRVIGDTLKKELERVLQQDQQAILFLNRRGFSGFLLCRDCGSVIRCPYCDITLTFHKVERSIKCHYCDYSRPAPDVCPFCSSNRLATPSLGIQKVEEELRELFPGLSYIRMDRDTTTARGSHYRLLKKFANRKASVLMGTQMVAKGLDFPGVTLVGVILADVSLYLPDFRSLERTYQILTQVAGRAGRRKTRGKVIIQTYNPDTPVITAVARQDYDRFFNWEVENRRKLDYPPFSHVINLLFTGKDSEKIREYSLTFGDLLRSRKLKKYFYSVLGPAPCPISRIKSRYRWHVTLKGKKVPPMNTVIKMLLDKYPLPSGVRLSIDVDPVSLM